MEESPLNLELIDEAIKKLLAENKNQKENSSDDHILLNRLLSELEVLKRESTVKEFENEVNSHSVGEAGLAIEEIDPERENSSSDEILKEIKQVKKQNFVTHCLLSALLVVTVVWQLSELTLILRLKDGVSHPFKSFGSFLGGIIKLPFPNGKVAEKEGHTEDDSPLPLHIPEIPQITDLSLYGDNK
ncbi:uncharacterized protein LOC126656079 [Mercurialis annua]|uniref:uncharacterized protein LOC126656079 n=1 Tax=Mercurialis annua TaxID=3986 RepID=UPI002160E1AE|nr:uncharacterized protein LOC126656079 [Mercurialis annua]